MKLDYYQLLSPEPVIFKQTGSFLSPTLREISRIGLPVYHTYLSFLFMTPEIFYSITDEEKYSDSLSLYELITMGNSPKIIQARETIAEALNFFMVEEVKYMEEYKIFLVFNGKDENGSPIPTGIIKKENYSLVCDIIAQRNNIRLKQEDVSLVKNEKARDIMRKIEKGRKKNSENPNTDKSFELGNIISKVCSRHPSINLLNVYELTVFQLYDAFYNVTNQLVYDLQSAAVAYNGSNAVPDFNYTDWFKIDNH